MVAPPANLRCSSETWRIENAARGGGPSITGTQQFVMSPAGRWRAQASFHLIEDDDYLEARGFMAGLDGQAGTFLIGPTDYRGQPWNADPLTGALITPRVQERSFRSDPAYLANADTTALLDFRASGAVALNATSMAISRFKGGALKRGQYFSFGNRLHIITEVPGGDDGTRAVVNVNFRPWTRAAYAAGAFLDFYAPRCLMRLSQDETGRVDMTTSPLSSLSLDLVEAL